MLEFGFQADHLDSNGITKGVQLSQLHLFRFMSRNFVFGAERLGREKVLKVVGLNPTGITKGRVCQNSRVGRPEGAKAHSPGQRPG